MIVRIKYTTIHDGIDTTAVNTVDGIWTYKEPENQA